jgi:thymidylate synthase
MRIALESFADTLPMAWEQSIVFLVKYGNAYKGRYWNEGMPEGRSSAMRIVCRHWSDEPIIHRGFTCTPDDLVAYGNELTDGSDRGWEYTYHSRMRSWGTPGKLLVDQYDYALHCLTRKQTSNKAVITLGDPAEECIRDGDGTHIPCLRTIKWDIECGNELDTYLHWRSRDAINAAYPNLYGMLQLTKQAARDLSSITGREIRVGGLIDTSDNYHVNGAHMHLAQKVMDMASKRPAEDRVWTSEQLRDMTHG